MPAMPKPPWYTHGGGGGTVEGLSGTLGSALLQRNGRPGCERVLVALRRDVREEAEAAEP